MLAVYDTNTDISSYLGEKTLSINENLTTRKNSCSFRLINNAISQGKSVYVYETMPLRAGASSGTAVLSVTDTFQDTGKFAAGHEIIVDIKGANQKKYTISSVDHSARTVTLTSNLDFNVTVSMKVGRLIFGGVCMSNPDLEIGQAATFVYDASCLDWSILYDRQVVVQQFQSMYLREILGRIVYYFCPADSSSTLEGFEAAWTHGGNGLAMADEATDRIRGAKAQKTGTSASGVSTWTKTITSQDISAYTKFRFWWKVAASYGSLVSAMKVRIGTDASNYFEYTVSNLGAAYAGCWNLESIDLNAYTATAGSPSLTTIAYLQIRLTTTAAIATGNVYFDQMEAFTGSFTLQNTVRGNSVFSDVRVSYKKPSAITETLVKMDSLQWYIDNDRDIHVFESDATAAPFALTDSSENYRKLSVETDISRLKNRIVVRGGEAVSTSLYTQTLVGNGSQTSFPLDYKPSGLAMTVNAVAQTVGVEGFADESTVQWIYNFNEKVIRKTASGTTPSNGHAIVITYYPYQPIRVRVTHPASIAAMAALTGADGIYDGQPINDASVSTFADAHTRGTAELAQWANAIRTATFETDTDGLRAGQVLTITDSSRSISAEEFLIQRVRKRSRMGSRFTYDVTASTTLFGLVEFMQMLLRRTEALEVSPSEIVDAMLNVDEEVTVTDSVATTARDRKVYAALKKTQVVDFVGLSGSKTSSGAMDTGLQWYAEFVGSETGTAQFTTSNHNNNAELRITTQVGGNGKELQVRNVFRLAAVPATLYTVDAWTEIQAALSNVGTGGGFQLVIKEWSAQTGGSALATNTIFSAVTSVHDFVKRTGTFTTNASTAWISIEISVYRAIGTGRLTDITITPATAETATLAGQASFCQSSS